MVVKWISSSIVIRMTEVLLCYYRMMEPVDPHKAAYYYLATADLHEIEEKYRDVASAVRGAVNMYARARQ